MKTSEIKSGRIYSWVYGGDAKLLKGGRANTNPFNDLVVTVRKTFAGQAATGETWYKAQIALNPDYEPSNRPAQHVATENPCVVAMVSTGELCVRIMNFRKTSEVFFVAGKPATEAQVAIIKEYLPARKHNDKFVPVMFPYVHNLTNVDDDMAIAAGLTFEPVTTAPAHVTA